MQIHRLDAQTVALEDLDPFCAKLLRKIPQHADPTGHAAAEARLFSTPTHGAEPQADAEWKEYVEPDLRQLFIDTVNVVKEDLAGLATTGSKSQTLRLPLSHLEAWVHALNQARLALAARYDFTERDMDHQLTLDTGPRALALFEVRFYGLLQEFFLQQLDADPL